MNQRRRPRRGITLIEVIVVMSGVAVALGLCAVTIQLLLRLNGDGHARLNASASFARLASQFREDVHACDEVVLLPAAKAAAEPGKTKGAASLRLTLDPKTFVTYEAREGRVARVETASGTRTEHESYRVGKGNVVAFEQRDEGAIRFVVMVMSREVGKGQLEPPRPLEVLALPGKDRPAASRTKGDRPR